MPSFNYKAVSTKGREVVGQETAPTEQELARTLHEKGYVLISATTGSQRSWEVPNPLEKLLGVSLTDKLMFVRNLEVMVSAGVPLPKALAVLSRQTKSKRFQTTIAAVRKAVLKGSALSEAMERHSQVFSELFVNMVRVGEEAGTLQEVLGHLTVQLEREHELRSRVTGALIYPAVVVAAMGIVGILMLVVVVPQLARTFQDLNVELPATTRAIIATANFFTEFWYLAAALFVVLLVAGMLAWRTERAKRLFDTAVLKVPLFGGIVRKTNAAFTVRTLSSLVASGVPITRSLEITSSVVGNGHFGAALKDAAERIRQGAKLSEVLSEYRHLYPVLVVQMVEVGEETGQTSDILAKLAEFFEEEVASVTDNLASVIEPVLMLFIGVVVGFFAVSMLQPMYSLLGAAQ